jgi:ABC-2 type transport system ATP-binding protein
MRALIREENRERGTTFLVSSHQLDDVERLCDRIGVLHRGRLVAGGRIVDLLSQAISGFRVRCDRPEAAMESIRRALPESAPAREPDGHVHVRGDASILSRLHRALLDAEAPAVEVLPVRASLERYFLDLTEGEMG